MMSFPFARFVCCLLFMFFWCSLAAPQIQIASIERSVPSSNSHVIYDDKQILMVDVGKEESDALQLITLVNKLASNGRKVNAIFVTHGHPDHCMALWKMQEAFPDAKAYVANNQIKNELLAILNYFTLFLNQSSPGNPLGKNVSTHYNYSMNVNVLEGSDPVVNPEIWMGPGIEVIQQFRRTAESNHYAMIYIPEINSLLTGDLIFVNAHMFLGYDVSFQSQCDWLSQLFETAQTFPPDTQLYPGHGTLGLPNNMTTQDVIIANINYIMFCRKVFVNTCNQTYATDQIAKEYSTYSDEGLLTLYTVPFRVPGDATVLGCDCSASPPTKVCNQVPPPCLFWE